MVARQAASEAGNQVGGAGGAQLAVEIEVATRIELDAGSVHQHGYQRQDRHRQQAGHLPRDRAPVHEGDIGWGKRWPQPAALRQRYQPVFVAQHIVRDRQRPDHDIEEDQ